MQICKTVTLRKRARANGTYSLYLDYYPGFRDKTSMKLIRRQTLGIYIYQKPVNADQRAFNARMMLKAEALRCRVFEEVINERYDFFSKRNMSNSFLTYLEKRAENKSGPIYLTYRHFSNFTGGKCSFAELDSDLCAKFKEYLTTPIVIDSFKSKVLSSVTASSYWGLFRSALRQAYKDGWLKDNLAENLPIIKKEGKIREVLNLQEVRMLYHTPCCFEVLKRAALFSVMTGLRYSDIFNLTWNNVRSYSDGGWYIEFVSQKTRGRNIVPITEEAYHLLPKQNDEDEHVFLGFNRKMAGSPLRDWVKQAGITKYITFHCFRHTYASLLVEMGTDVYTVQGLLDHKSVRTTQIYARHSDVRKREAAAKIVLAVKEDADFDPFAPIVNEP